MARLRRLLDALRAQTLDPESFEIVVVDDGSSDATRGLLVREAASAPDRDARSDRPRSTGAGDQPGGPLDTLGPTLIAITHPAGVGPAAARNMGWRAAAARLIAFTDDDCEPAPTWLERAVEAAHSQPLVPIQGRTLPNPREVHRLGPFTRTLSIERPGPFYETANMTYPRALLERLGGFDESYPAPGGEDTDLAWRAIEQGARPHYAADALVHHAVEDLGPRGHLRVALRWADAMAMFRHPGLREEALLHGIFWKRSHLELLQAAAGALAGTRFKPAALLALPYARSTRARCRELGAPPAFAAYLALHDTLETIATIRGAIRSRVLVI